MKIVLGRDWRKNTYTISRVFIDGVRFYESLEDKDRGLTQDMSLSTIAGIKVPGETAIPRGIYTVDMETVSPKYAAIPWYKELCGGKMPRVLNVKGFDGILFHPGTTNLDTKGCILIGRNLVKGELRQSKETFKKFYNKLLTAHKKGEKITLEIL